MNGAELKPFLQDLLMGVKEEGCHTDMHRLEGRGIWKGRLRKAWWYDAEEKKGRGLSLCLGCLK